MLDRKRGLVCCATTAAAYLAYRTRRPKRLLKVARRIEPTCAPVLAPFLPLALRLVSQPARETVCVRHRRAARCHAYLLPRIYMLSNSCDNTRERLIVGNFIRHVVKCRGEQEHKDGHTGNARYCETERGQRKR